MAKHKYFDKRLEAVQQRWIIEVVSKLTSAGWDIISEALDADNREVRTDTDKVYTPPEWKIVSGTLSKSYGSAVYVNGQVEPSSIVYAGDYKYQSVNFETGEISSEEAFVKDRITRYLLDHKPDKINIIEFVVVNAALYASDLEKGNTPNNNKYVVISQMADEMEAVNNRLNIGKYRRKVKKIGDF